MGSHSASVGSLRRVAALAAAMLLLACLALAQGCGREQAPLGTGAVLGVVLDDATGEPIEGADAVLSAPGVSEARAVADAEGRFRLDAPSAGPTSVRVRAEGYEERKVEGIRVGGDTSIPLEVRLPAGAGPRVEVRGAVRDSEGRTLSGVLVATGGARTRTRADGTFGLSVPAGRRARLTFGLAGYATLRREAALDGSGARIAVTLERSRGRALTGRIIDAHDGEGIAGATVASASGAAATSENGGAFRLDGLEAGTLEVTVAAPGYRSETRTVEIPQAARETALDVPLVAPSSGTVRVHVRDRAGLGIAQAAVTLEPGGRTATTDAAGEAAVEHVAIGECRVRVERADWGSASVEGVAVDDAEPADVSVEIKPTLAGLRGTLVDGAGRPLPGARVTVTGLASGPLSLTADEEGRFEAHGLFVGDGRPRLTLEPSGTSAVAHVTLEPGGCVDAGPLAGTPTR